jgi:hypothetical protein
MSPATGTAILVLATFVLPGFVTLRFRERTYWIRGEDSPFERLLNALYYSSLIYLLVALAAWIAGRSVNDATTLYRGDASPGVYFGVAAAGLLVLPLAIAEIGRRWHKSSKLRPGLLKYLGIDRGHSVPSGWEQMFSASQGALEGSGLMLRVTLEDGRVVGGFFGRDSLAGYTAHTRDLFLEDRWSLDDDAWLVASVPGNRGLWISESQIRSIEVYAPVRPAAERRSGADRRQGSG